VRAKLVKAAAALLEASPDDIEIEDGQASCAVCQPLRLPLARVVQASIPTFARPGVASPDFEATAYHHVPTSRSRAPCTSRGSRSTSARSRDAAVPTSWPTDCGKVINR